MPGRIPYRDPREQYPPEAAGLPGSPIIIEGAGGFGEGGYEAGNQTAYIPVAGQPIYQQGINPQAASYLSQLSERGAQMNQGLMAQQQEAAASKKAYFEKLLGKDFVIAYEANKAAGLSPQETYDRAWKYKVEQEKFRMQMALQREKAVTKERSPDFSRFKQEIGKVNSAGQPIYSMRDIEKLGEQYNIPPEQVKAEINSIVDSVRMQATGMAERPSNQPAPRQQNIPSVEEFIQLARPLNPGMSDNEIADQYYLKYGGQ